MFDTLAPPTAPMAEKLAASAFSLFSASGISGVSLDESRRPRRCHQGQRLSPLRFQKDRSILAACDHYYEAWAARIREETALLSDPADQLEAVLAFSVRSCVADPAKTGCSPPKSSPSRSSDEDWIPHRRVQQSAYFSFEKCLEWAQRNRVHYIECGVIDG
jgi:hypothetical protein